MASTSRSRSTSARLRYRRSPIAGIIERQRDEWVPPQRPAADAHARPLHRRQLRRRHPGPVPAADRQVPPEPRHRRAGQPCVRRHGRDLSAAVRPHRRPLRHTVHGPRAGMDGGHLRGRRLRQQLPPPAGARPGLRPGVRRLPSPGRARRARAAPRLAAVIGVMMSRSWTVNVFQAFTPTWYRELGYGPAFYGPLATTLVLASAVGTVGCGSLADRYGRRTVIIVTLVLTIPAVLLFTLYPGPWAFGSAILIGFLAASTAPLLLLMAQQLMAARAGLASGLVMGLGFVTGAIGVPINGAVADAVGLQTSLL